MTRMKRESVPMWFGTLVTSFFWSVNVTPTKLSGAEAIGFWIGFTAVSGLMYWLICSGLWRGTHFLWASISKAMKPQKRLSVGHDSYDD